VKRRSLKVVRRIPCPACTQELDVTRGELRVGVAHCVCGAQVALDAEQVGAGPGRAMQVLQPRALLGGPPTERIVPRVAPHPTLLFPDAGLSPSSIVMGVAVLACIPIALLIPWWFAAALVVLLVLGLPRLLAPLRSRERLEIAGGSVTYRSRAGVVTAFPLETLDFTVSGARLLLRGKHASVEVGSRLERVAEAAWVAAWLRENTRSD
jgi:hypothetical protein